AKELSEDIERYLHNQHIQAKPPGKLRKASYRLRRNRPLFLSLLSLVLSIFIIIVFYLDNLRDKALSRNFTTRLIEMAIKQENEKRKLEAIIKKGRQHKWRLLHAETFDSPESLKNWDIDGGKAEIKDGKLHIAADKATNIIFNRHVRGDIKLVFEATVTSDYLTDIACFFDSIYDYQMKKIIEKGYFLQYGGLSNTANILRKGGSGNILWKESISPLTKGQTYRVAAERISGRIKLTVNGKKIFTFKDPEPLYGYNRTAIGFYGWGADYIYDNIEIYTLGIPSHPDLLEIARKQEQLERYQTASDLYREIILSADNKKRIKQARKALARTKLKFSIQKNKKRYEAEFSKLYPGAETILSFQSSELRAKISDKSNKIYDLNKLIKLPINRLTVNSTRLKDLSALKYLPLTHLTIQNAGLKDINMLQNINLKGLNLVDMNELIDISALKNMPLNSLKITNSRITDISSLKNLPLKNVEIHTSPVTNVAPLAGLKLNHLTLINTSVNNLAPIAKNAFNKLNIAGSPVDSIQGLNFSRMHYLEISDTKVEDISAIENSIIKKLKLSNLNIKDFSPVATLTLNEFNANGTGLADLSILNKSRTLLRKLDIANSKVTDLQLLKTVRQLDLLVIDTKQAEKNKTLLKTLKNIETIQILDKHRSQ
ncbi:MAG: family 16 glycoside hydrolase, partial [Planctomycetota bacterium]